MKLSVFGIAAFAVIALVGFAIVTLVTRAPTHGFQDTQSQEIGCHDNEDEIACIVLYAYDHYGNDFIDAGEGITAGTVASLDDLEIQTRSVCLIHIEPDVGDFRKDYIATAWARSRECTGFDGIKNESFGNNIPLEILDILIRIRERSPYNPNNNTPTTVPPGPRVRWGNPNYPF